MEMSVCQEPWNNLQGSRNFSILKAHNQVVTFKMDQKRGRGGWEGHKQIETKFQSFYSKQLLTMYKYCILAHMKNTTSKAPRNMFIYVTGPFTKSGRFAPDSI